MLTRRVPLAAPTGRRRPAYWRAARAGHKSALVRASAVGMGVSRTSSLLAAAATAAAVWGPNGSVSAYLRLGNGVAAGFAVFMTAGTPRR